MLPAGPGDLEMRSGFGGSDFERSHERDARKAAVAEHDQLSSASL